MVRLLKIYWFALLMTGIIWVGTLVSAGWNALFTVVILTVLEATFSADNAIINSSILTTLSRRWQKLFMTVGIFVAVFVVRFALPLIIVMLTSGNNFNETINLALYDPDEYAHQLHHAAPVISAFGGAFLVMIALSYFINYEKEVHWLKFLERRLGKLGAVDDVTTFIMLVATLVLYFTLEPGLRGIVLAASVCAMALHIGLGILNAAFSKTQKATAGVMYKTGTAAFASFMYLELLDASFSLDSVIGAFAITSSVLLIALGLGAGAVWVRAMTIHLVRDKTLDKYRYLEQGAHWAIGFLGAIMLLKLYHIELPEWFVGTTGLMCIGLAIAGSLRPKKEQ